MKERIHKIGKGIKKIVDDKIQAVRIILSSAQNRLILGLIIFGLGVGLGGGLIASAYLAA
jgi:hypothetical protein